MAPHALLSRLAQEVRPILSKLVLRTTGSCSGPTRDPPCECPAPPGPLCRTVVSRPAPVLRVLCRPPSPASPPPCPPCEAPAALTCTDLVNRKSSQEIQTQPVSTSSEPDHLERGRDRVACRLARAESTRRRNYEQEAALEPSSRPRRAPRAYYQLRDDVHHVPEDGCSIRRVVHSDPCAHRPRVLLEVQRTPSEPPSVPTPAPSHEPRSNSKAHDDNAASHGRCERTMPPGAGPPRCRPLSIVERLRGLSRAAGSERPGDRRGLHASAGESVPTELDACHEDGLEKTLQTRERLREAGRGRVACAASEPGSAVTRALGTLELGVPAGARRLRVRVTLENGDEARVVAPARKNRLTPGNVTDSWLSIKNIQGKLSGRKKETCALTENKMHPRPTFCPEQSASAGPGAGAGAGAGAGGATVLLSAAPVPSQ